MAVPWGPLDAEPGCTAAFRARATYVTTGYGTSNSSLVSPTAGFNDRLLCVFNFSLYSILFSMIVIHRKLCILD